MLLDILGDLPSAAVVRLAAGQRYALAQHTVLLQGQLLPAVPRSSYAPLGFAERVLAPAVLPKLAGQQRLRSFYRDPLAGAAGGVGEEAVYQAGPEGALLVACS